MLDFLLFDVVNKIIWNKTYSNYYKSSSYVFAVEYWYVTI